MITLSPIILVQDSDCENVSTTNDVLNQLDLIKYGPTLSGIDLHQFMNMTNEKDFKQFGIRTADCRRLSVAAQSIKSSLCSDDEDSYLEDSASFMRCFNSLQDQWPNSKRRASLPNPAPPKYEAKKRSVSFSESRSIVQETLPEYSCTVEKIGIASAKIERLSPTKKPTYRPWRTIYIKLQGTMIQLYEKRQPRRHSYYTLSSYYYQDDTFHLSMSLSLTNAIVEIPLDYTKKPNVFRLVIENGPKILFQVQTCAAVLLWIEKIASGINIAGDLDYQHMPKFPPCLFLFEDTTNTTYNTLVNEEYQRNLSIHNDCLI